MRTRLGDVVIWRLQGLSACGVVLIREDGEQIEGLEGRWQLTSEKQADIFARRWVNETGGRILEWDGSGEPLPRQ